MGCFIRLFQRGSHFPESESPESGSDQSVFSLMKIAWMRFNQRLLARILSLLTTVYPVIHVGSSLLRHGGWGRSNQGREHLPIILPLHSIGCTSWIFPDDSSFAFEAKPTDLNDELNDIGFAVFEMAAVSAAGGRGAGKGVFEGFAAGCVHTGLVQGTTRMAEYSRRKYDLNGSLTTGEFTNVLSHKAA